MHKSNFFYSGEVKVPWRLLYASCRDGPQQRFHGHSTARSY